MATYLQLQTRLAREMKRSDLTAEIKDAIQYAIRYHSQKQFWFNEKKSNFNTVAGQSEYSSANGFPSDFVKIHRITAFVSNRNYPVEPVSYMSIVDVDGGIWNGYPNSYGIFGKSLRLYPTPNQVFPITVYFTQSLPILSADADTNAWTEDAEDLIFARAMIYLLEVVTMETNRVDRLRLFEDEVLNVLNKRSGQYVGSGSIQGEI
jgi:hypothetical protein